MNIILEMYFVRYEEESKMQMSNTFLYNTAINSDLLPLVCLYFWTCLNSVNSGLWLPCFVMSSYMNKLSCWNMDDSDFCPEAEFVFNLTFMYFAYLPFFIYDSVCRMEG